MELNQNEKQARPFDSLGAAFASLYFSGVIVLVAGRIAVGADCPPDKDVCVTTLSQPDDSTAINSSFSGESFVREVRGAAIRAVEWVFNDPLITFSIILVIFLVVALFWKLRPRVPHAKLRKARAVSYGDQRLALLQKIDRETGALQSALVEIQSILSQYSDRKPIYKTSNDSGNARQLVGAADQAAPESEARIILTKIIHQVLQVSDRLTEVRNDARQVKNNSLHVDDANREIDRERGQAKKMLALLEEKQIQLDLVAQENSRLRQELEGSRSLSESANKRYHEADRLLAAYENGLPSFITSTEQGAHFPNFLELLLTCHATHAPHVSRLGMMLRVAADASARDDSGFELIWSVHEIGKALYLLMHALGADQQWQFEEATAWAVALNKFGAGRYTVFVPAIRSAFNGLEMTGGNPQSLINDVRGWGVKNRRGDVERKAVVK